LLAEAASTGGSTPAVAKTRDQLKQLLKARGKVGRLIIVSHGSTAGQVFFQDESGGTTLKQLAAELSGVATVSEVAFRGCNTGNDPSGLNDIKAALASTSAEGSNCPVTVAHAGPITVNNIPIDTEARFQALLPDTQDRYHRRLRTSTQGHGDCIVELKPGVKMADMTNVELRALAMRHGGRLIMQYASDNTCWNDLKFGGSGRCKRVQAR
jgi:hypothetical protein